jgi:hypothetical protein
MLSLQGCKDSPLAVRKVEVRKEEGGYVLYRNNRPYEIKGVVGADALKEVKAAGGNSVRTYGGENLQEILDSAQALDLTVIVGIYVPPLKHGFDYSDKKACRQLKQQIRKQVLEYKDHPALLLWGLGNEVNMNADGELENPIALWSQINDLAEMIHELDPDHPVSTMMVPGLFSINIVKLLCPELDILSFNTFGPVHQLGSKLNYPVFGWKKPYLISEWGSKGWWEVDKTSWGAPLEETSTQKAVFQKEKYQKAILEKPRNCLGAYAFYWGEKQERTKTWFSMLDSLGNISAPAYMLSQFWLKGKERVNQPPILDSITLPEIKKSVNRFLVAGSDIKVHAFYRDSKNDRLTVRWEIRPESLVLTYWGEKETDPGPVFLKTGISQPGTTIKIPEEEGPYRLFCYVYDDKGAFAAGNLPFYVLKE